MFMKRETLYEAEDARLHAQACAEDSVSVVVGFPYRTYPSFHHRCAPAGARKPVSGIRFADSRKTPPVKAQNALFNEWRPVGHGRMGYV